MKRNKSEYANSDINSLMISSIEIHNVNIMRTFENSTFIIILGDTSAQGRGVSPSIKHDKTNVLGMTNMANRSKAKIYQCDDTTIVDGNGTEM